MQYRKHIKRFSTYWVWVFREYFYQGCFNKASALALSSLFAVVPLLMVSLSILSMLPAFKDLQSEFQEFIVQNFIPSASEAISKYLQIFLHNRVGLPVTAVVVLFIISIMMIRSMEKVLNGIWYVKKQRPLVQAILLYWAVLTLGPILVGASLALSSYIASLHWFGHSFGGYVSLLALLPFIFNWIAFSFIYQVLPYTRVRFFHALLGGLLMAVVFDLAKKIFSAYVVYLPTYEMLYGTLAIIPLFILWVGLVWQMFLLGAVAVKALSVTHQQKTGIKEPRFEHYLELLKLLYVAELNKKRVSLLALSAKVDMSTLGLQKMLNQLEKYNYIIQMNGHYLLISNLERLSVSECYADMGAFLSLDEDKFKGLSGMRLTLKQLMAMPVSALFQDSKSEENKRR
ncbi:YihY family inner membrane protein [Fangia hongkongensis]|uniref:YihY family inner membrane protein n=1 Tax=Fangia hongkongensis TaxID=270495 RepID=UPI000366D9FB|nr:YihY family inner membrane protein [Fangia hongkongensis]MBK2124914.1 YihY family inner membrane protein [Fangia hongkongensis]